MAKTFNRLDNLQLQENQAASGSLILKNLEDVDSAKVYNLMPVRVFDDLMLKKKLVTDNELFWKPAQQQAPPSGISKIEVGVKILDDYKNAKLPVEV
jgi:hypothetical protein